MYQHFNPWENPGAWWQHILILIVAGVLGYIIGYISRKNEIEELEAKLAGLENDVDDCLRSKKKTVEVEPIARQVATPVVAYVPLPPPPPVVAPVVVVTPDDLKIVEGIGPKIEILLNNEGILTFAQLATTSPDRLTEILRAAGSRFQIHDPGTWPQQSALARDGKWDELKQWQDELNKGKKV